MRALIARNGVRFLLVLAALAALGAAAGALAPLAHAGGPIVPGDPEPDAQVADETKRAFDLFRKRDYRAARAAFEEALKKGGDEDTVHGYLARIAYFYAEDGVAREHLAKIRSRTPWDERLAAILDTPFRPHYKDAVTLMSGLTPGGRYYLATDLGFDPKQWDAAKAEYAQLAAHAEKKKAAQKALEKFLAEKRSEGWKACAKALDAIYEAYESIFPSRTFAKDPKLVARVFVFKERADYLEFAKYITGTDNDETAGFYQPTFRLLMVSSRDTGKQYGGGLWQATREVMFHEAFHQYIDYFIEDCPSWLNEGLAEFFATAEDDPKTGRLVLGNVQKEAVGMGLTNYQIIKGALKPSARFPLYPIRELIRMPQSKLYAEDLPDRQDREHLRAQNYAQGWAICQFLIQGHPKGKKILVDYLKALKSGLGNEEAIAQAFKGYDSDEDWEKLDKQFRAYFSQL